MSAGKPNVTTWTGKRAVRYGSDAPFLYRLKNGKLLLLWSPYPIDTYVVCSAVSDHDVGVDCETVREIDYEALSKRFFTQPEYERIKGAADPADEFFRIWTKKESYVKFTGEGFSRPLSSFDVADIEDIQTTFRIGNTYITLTGDVTHVKFIKEGRRK